MTLWDEINEQPEVLRKIVSDNAMWSPPSRSASGRRRRHPPWKRHEAHRTTQPGMPNTYGESATGSMSVSRRPLSSRYTRHHPTSQDRSLSEYLNPESRRPSRRPRRSPIPETTHACHHQPPRVTTCGGGQPPLETSHTRRTRRRCDQDLHRIACCDCGIVTCARRRRWNA